jgi:hypothetical protein
VIQKPCEGEGPDPMEAVMPKTNKISPLKYSKTIRTSIL